MCKIEMESAQIAVVPPASFECFPELPVELRLKIWRHTFPRARIVGISHKFTSRQFIGWKSPDGPPVAFRVSRESRGEALKHYKLSFGTPSAPASIYFNFKLDTLRFGYGAGDDYLKSPNTWLENGPSAYLLNLFLGTHYFQHPKMRIVASNYERLQYMIIDVDEDIYDRKYFCWGEIRRFSNLKDLTLLPWNDPLIMTEVLAMFKSTLNKAAKDFPDWTVPNITVVSPFKREELARLKADPTEDEDES